MIYNTDFKYTNPLNNYTQRGIYDNFYLNRKLNRTIILKKLKKNDFSYMSFIYLLYELGIFWVIHYVFIILLIIKS